MIAAAQEICDRTALATGTGLGELALKRFNLKGRWIVGGILSALIVANTLNISADLVAIGSGMNLLRAGPTWIWALLAGIVISVLVVKGSFEYLTQVFKILAGTLVVYIVVMVSVTHDWMRILQYGVIPHIQLTKSYISLLAALLGTTISPYIFFWQSANRLEEMHEEPEGGPQVEPLTERSVQQAKFKQRTSRLDVFSGMAFSNVVMYAIIGTSGQTLNTRGITNIQSATQIASALKPIAGSLASVIFALGFIGSGLLAIPVLAASGSIGLSGLLGKEWGFSRKLREAPLFYVLVAVGTIGGTVLSLLNINPISLLVFVAIINAIISVPLLLLVMIISNSRDLMGNYVNGYAANIIGGLTCVAMLVALIALFATGGISL